MAFRIMNEAGECATPGHLEGWDYTLVVVAKCNLAADKVRNVTFV